MTRLGLILVVMSLGACRCDTFRFYEVTRTVQEECDIRPNGEFCDEPEGFSPPVVEVWAVERVGEETRVYIDEEVWLANPPDQDDDPDFFVADKLEIAAREPGPCVTTTSRSFQITANDAELIGFMSESSRVEGPEECGETPTGVRRVVDLAGTIEGAP
jgi:hypothetical protein